MVEKFVVTQRKGRQDVEDYEMIEDLEPQIKKLNLKTTRIMMGKFR